MQSWYTELLLPRLARCASELIVRRFSLDDGLGFRELGFRANPDSSPFNQA